VKTLLVLACLSIKLMTTEFWPTTATQPPAKSDLIVEHNENSPCSAPSFHQAYDNRVLAYHCHTTTSKLRSDQNNLPSGPECGQLIDEGEPAENSLVLPYQAYNNIKLITTTKPP
jgi:hypothetical protein